MPQIDLAQSLRRALLLSKFVAARGESAFNTGVDSRTHFVSHKKIFRRGLCFVA